MSKPNKKTKREITNLGRGDRFSLADIIKNCKEHGIVDFENVFLNVEEEWSYNWASPDEEPILDRTYINIQHIAK